MALRKSFLAILLAVAAGGAEAQVSRVFVSVTGNDANVCSDIATPCRTLTGGITQVDAQGEVIVVTSGSYAGGSITKSVKINVPSGIVAFSGLPITVDPGAGGTVVLRGLTLKAATAGTGTGITQQSGTLFLENMVVDGWSVGLFSTTSSERLFVKRSVFRNNASVGANLTSGGPLPFGIEDSFFENNTTIGLFISAGNLTAPSRGRVSNSVFARNGIGAYVNGTDTVATFQRCQVSSNVNQGLLAGNGSTLRVAGSTITRNGVGLENLIDGATVESFGNNVIRGNVGGSNQVGTISPVSLQ